MATNPFQNVNAAGRRVLNLSDLRVFLALSVNVIRGTSLPIDSNGGFLVPLTSRDNGLGICAWAPNLTIAATESKFGVVVSKRTFQPNNRRRAKVHGFRLRMRTRAGRAIVNARRSRGRKSITA